MRLGAAVPGALEEWPGQTTLQLVVSQGDSASRGTSRDQHSAGSFSVVPAPPLFQGIKVRKQMRFPGPISLPPPTQRKMLLCPFRRPPGAEEERQGRQARTTWLEKQQAIFQLDLNERFGSPPAHSIRQNPSLGTGETQPLSAVPPAPSRRRVLPSSLSLTFPLLLAVMSLTMIILPAVIIMHLLRAVCHSYLIYFSNHPSGAGERCTAVTFFFFC